MTYYHLNPTVWCATHGYFILSEWIFVRVRLGFSDLMMRGLCVRVSVSEYVCIKYLSAPARRFASERI